MLRRFARAGMIFALLNGVPAFAFTNPLSSVQVVYFNPLERGPLADFLNIFRKQAIPRRIVAWHGGQAPGTVVISTCERRLYYILRDGDAIEYGVGVGRRGFAWSGTKTVSMKREWPDWTPPAEMFKRQPDLPPAELIILSARVRYTLVRACTASMGRTSQIRLGPPCRPAASV
jgi:lipoprotein-anchoring transpeptidase ErfK/SrfK